MTDQPNTPVGGSGDEPDPTRPRFTDKRRIDPQTGAVREPAADEHAAPGEHGAPDDAAATDEQSASPADGAAELLDQAQALAAERLADLQRLQAEYVNYRRRVDRDRDVARDQAVIGVVEALMGALDDIDLARQHGELEGGPFAAIAEKLEAALGRFGWERYGAAGEPFDPTVHEALMHSHADDVTEPTVVQVLQPGHRVGERVVRAARVAVADPGA
ncbi:molecular chaperone GrpE [Actinotalea ferrariae CF5-4]|uniref:Protein GrpE n=1 Tax=Actinotalea ferrariae CF5-4 TaxID=948458 RepID=A0A021VS73_9CELL|nr:nucleotide exchange factor GrpE [Actinotalea ferrariae]EYR62875.1 molecular chaperone GrpE [Actinotalea ferrariae CF5-4]